MTLWYKAIACDNTVADPLVTDADNLGMDPEHLDIGRPVETWSDNAWLRANKPTNDGEPDDVIQHHLILPVYSARLRSALKRGGIGGMQYLPVQVFRPNGEKLEGFAIANLLERRPAIDLERTECAFYPEDYFLPERRGRLRSIKKVTLKGNVLEGCDIVRLDLARSK